MPTGKVSKFAPHTIAHYECARFERLPMCGSFVRKCLCALFSFRDGDFIDMAMSALETARNLETSGDIVGALEKYRELYAQTPNDEDVVLGIANCALAIDALEIALEYYVRLLILNHHNPWGFYGRATVLLRYDMTEKALADIDSALALDAPPSSLRIDIAALLNAYAHHELALSALDPLKAAYISAAAVDARDFLIEYAVARIALNQIDDPDLLKIMAQFESLRTEDGIYALCLAAYDYCRHKTTYADYEACALQYPDLVDYADILVAHQTDVHTPMALETISYKD